MATRKRVAITGAGGFLGMQLARLVKETQPNWELVLVSSRGSDFFCCHGFTEFCVVSPEQVVDTPCLLKNIDVLVNCSFPRSEGGVGFAEGLAFVNSLFFAAAEAGVREVVNVSSQSVYDSSRMYAASESSPLLLDSPYAVGKYASELFLADACPGVLCANIRLASLIGPQFNQRVLNTFIKKAIGGLPLKIEEHGRLFGYLDVRDAADALLLLCQYGCQSGRTVYNVGIEGGYTIEEMACSVVSTLGKGVVELTCKDTTHVGGTQLDASAFREDFKWNPKRTLQDTILSIAESKSMTC